MTHTIAYRKLTRNSLCCHFSPALFTHSSSSSHAHKICTLDTGREPWTRGGVVWPCSLTVFPRVVFPTVPHLTFYKYLPSACHVSQISYSTISPSSRRVTLASQSMNSVNFLPGHRYLVWRAVLLPWPSTAVLMPFSGWSSCRPHLDPHLTFTHPIPYLAAENLVIFWQPSQGSAYPIN